METLAIVSIQNPLFPVITLITAIAATLLPIKALLEIVESCREWWGFNFTTIFGLPFFITIYAYCGFAAYIAWSFVFAFGYAAL